MNNFYRCCNNKVISIQIRTLKRPPLNTSQLKEGRRVGALAMKVGMLAVWDAWGKRIPVTILQLDNCQVVSVKTEEKHGYTALQVGVGEAKLSRVPATIAGHYNKVGLPPNRKLQEFRVTPDAMLPIGTKILASHFLPGQLIDVRGKSKGKGTQGVMKKWNFGGGDATHGVSLSHRIPGSLGMCQDPGRVFKGKKMAGRMGFENVTVQNLKIIKIEPQRNLIYVKGAIPGTNGSFLSVVDAVKGPFHPVPPPFPTSDGSEYLNLKDESKLWAPVSETDAGIFKIPENQLVT